MTPTYQGNPVVVLTIPPDWTSPVTLRIAHKTAAFETLDLHEDRLRQYARPLYGISYQATLIDSRQQGVIRKLFELAEDQPAGVPLWTETVRLSSGVSAGALDLPVSEGLRYSLLPVFRYAILWRDWLTWEIVEIESTSETFVTLALGVEGEWPAGTLLVPLPLGYVSKPDFAGLSAEVSAIQIDFDEVFHRELNQVANIDSLELTRSTGTDDMQSYEDSLDATQLTLNGGGDRWDGPWVIHGYVAQQGYDDCQEYSDGIIPDLATAQPTLNKGEGWATNWVVLDYTEAGEDTMESYSDSSDVTTVTLSAGFKWSGPWTIYDYGAGGDDMESYEDSEDATAETLDGGTQWAGAWTIRDYA